MLISACSNECTVSRSLFQGRVFPPGDDKAAVEYDRQMEAKKRDCMNVINESSFQSQIVLNGQEFQSGLCTSCKLYTCIYSNLMNVDAPILSAVYISAAGTIVYQHLHSEPLTCGVVCLSMTTYIYIITLTNGYCNKNCLTVIHMTGDLHFHFHPAHV